MKKTLKYLLAATTMTVISGSATAQHLSSAYFLDGYAQGHELNPAKDYDRKGYIGFPVLSNINVGIKGNLNLTDFLYQNPNGRKGLVTYLHPDIDTKTALSGFSDNNNLSADMRLELLSVGFHAFKGYNTINLGLRTNVGMNVPYDLFDLTKNLTNKDYNIENFGATAMAYAELGLGHSRQINKAFRIGAKAKVLVGGAYAKLKMDNLHLDLSDVNRWTATAKATVEAGVKGLTWGEPKQSTDNQGRPYEEIDFDNIDLKDPGIGGLGAAFDLGVEWDLGKHGLLKGLKVGVSVLDLGFIKWNDVLIAKNNGTPFYFDGFEDIKVKDGNGEKFDDQLDKLEDRLSELYRLQDGGTTSKKTSLGVTLNIAAQYALPFYSHLKFGFLSTTRIQDVYSWNEERFSVTVSPVKAFEASVNYGVGTFGSNVGWIVNFHPRGFNLFLGSDHCVGKLSKQYIPLRSNYDFCMGVNFPIGKSKVRLF